MNQNQITILYELRKIAGEQYKDSNYFTEGTALDNFSIKEVAKEIPELEQLGYVEVLKGGIKLTQAGLDWVNTDEQTKLDQQKAEDEAKAQQEAMQQILTQAIAVMAVLKNLPNFDQVVTDIFTRAKELNL